MNPCTHQPDPVSAPAAVWAELPRKAKAPLRLVPAVWREEAWRARVTVAGRKARLKPHDTSFTRRTSRFMSQLSRNKKQLLRHIVL